MDQISISKFKMFLSPNQDRVNFLSSSMLQASVGVISTLWPMISGIQLVSRDKMNNQSIVEKRSDKRLTKTPLPSKNPRHARLQRPFPRPRRRRSSSPTRRRRNQLENRRPSRRTTHVGRVPQLHTMLERRRTILSSSDSHGNDDDGFLSTICCYAGDLYGENS